MDKEAIKFTEDEIKSAKVVRNTVSQSPDELKSIYMAGEIVMWDELWKENEELKRDRDSYRESFEINKEQFMELATHATDLEATIIEKDKEIAELKNDMQTMEEQDKLRCETYEKLIGQMEEQQRTISELKGLVSRMYNEFIRAAENTSPAVSENNWQQFKKQNNL